MATSKDVSDGGSEDKETCPGCKGELRQIEHRWICQQSCGFETRAVSKAARVIFYQLCSQARSLLVFVRQADVALPGHSIMSDFKKFLDQEEI